MPAGRIGKAPAPGISMSNIVTKFLHHPQLDGIVPCKF
jgi:hypothetical protein